MNYNYNQNYQRDIFFTIKRLKKIALDLTGTASPIDFKTTLAISWLAPVVID